MEHKMIQYSYTILYVKDVDKSLTFYQNAFGFERKLTPPEKDYGELISGETKIAFAPLDLAESNLKGGFQRSSLKTIPFGIELGFATENPKAVLKR
ncbi:MAG: catechol 2,3-dioxygenase-like lactoylglutathione lyase family enzyme [Flammeovirgaceae bacterium]|jgi:catechol 2,3-dioxygenase-like lactoylglutathione lyase family enzyme